MLDDLQVGLDCHDSIIASQIVSRAVPVVRAYVEDQFSFRYRVIFALSRLPAGNLQLLPAPGTAPLLHDPIPRMRPFLTKRYTT